MALKHLLDPQRCKELKKMSEKKEIKLDELSVQTQVVAIEVRHSATEDQYAID